MYNIVTKKSGRFYFVLLTMGMLWGIMISPKVFAQGVSNANITGKVVDQYGNPVSDVTVTMKNSDFRVITGVDGVFKFQLKKLFNLPSFPILNIACVCHIRDSYIRK